MTTPIATTPAPIFTSTQWRALQALHMRYRHDRDLFSARELAYLRFLRWLGQTGQLVP